MSISNLNYVMPLEYERAKYAYDEVLKLIEKQKNDEIKKELKSWSAKFPTMVVNCGLLQAVTFYKEKKKDLYNLLQDWMKERFNIQVKGEFDLIEYLLNNIKNQNEYFLWTKEAIKFLTWVKRFFAIFVEG